LTEDYQKKVLEHLDRLPERQKLFVEASFAAYPEGNLEKAAEIYERLLELHPDEESVYGPLTTIYTVQFDQPEKALDTLEQGIKTLPRSARLRMDYGYQLLHVGRYTEGFHELETYAQLAPDEPNTHDSLGEAHLITGQPAKALQKYARALELDPSFGVSHMGRTWAYAMQGRYDEALRQDAKAAQIFTETGLEVWRAYHHFHSAFILSRLGRYQEAEEHIAKGFRLAASFGPPPYDAIDLELLSAQIALDREDHARVLQSVARAQKLLPQFPTPRNRRKYGVLSHLLAGTAEARSGRLEAARAQLDAQTKLYRPSNDREKWWHHCLEGEIALAAGDLYAAEAAFSAGEPELKMYFNLGGLSVTVFANSLPFRDGPARVNRAQGDLVAAVEIYRKLNTPGTDNKWTAMLEPRYVLEAARLLDEMGEEEAARAEYERFLELWKEADPGLPELEEAERYLSPEPSPPGRGKGEGTSRQMKQCMNPSSYLSSRTLSPLGEGRVRGHRDR
jgi:tetratricopeptide (TPR) repeat protein